MTVKIFTVATVPRGLEHAWLQHLRDFDTANAGCHFEVIAESPDATLSEIVDLMLIYPKLDVMQVIERGTHVTWDDDGKRVVTPLGAWPGDPVTPEDEQYAKEFHADADSDRPRPMTDEEIEAAARSDPDNPPLTKEQLARMMPHKDWQLVKSLVALLPDDKEHGLRILDAARRMVERFKR